MKTIHKIIAYGINWNPDGTRNGKMRVDKYVDVDGGQADATVVEAIDGTEETITGALAKHFASQASRETGLTLVAADMEF